MRKGPIWIILAVALALRASLLALGWTSPQRLLTTDSYDYDDLAEGLVQRGQYSQTAAAPPELFRAPGYPFFLAAIYAIAGHSPRLALAVQVLLDALLCYLVYAWGRRLLGDKAALAAAGVYAVSPAAIVSPLRLLSESLFALLLMLGLMTLWLYFRAGRPGRQVNRQDAATGPRPDELPPQRRRERGGEKKSRVRSAECGVRSEQKGRCFASHYALCTSHFLCVLRVSAARLFFPALAGLLLGASCLVRQIGLPFLLAVTVLLACRKGRRWAAAWFVLPAALVIAPWIARNCARAGYGQLAGVGDYNLMACNALALVEQRPDLPLTPRQKELFALVDKVSLWRPDQREPGLVNNPDTLRDCRREGLALVRSRPLLYAWVHLKTAMNIFVPASTELLEITGLTQGGKSTLAVLRRQGVIGAVRNYFREDTRCLLLAAPTAVLTLLIYVAAVLGAARHPCWRYGATGWLIFLTLFCFILIPGPVAYSRFRFPIEPLIALLAGAGLVWRSPLDDGGSLSRAGQENTNCTNELI